MPTVPKPAVVLVELNVEVAPEQIDVPEEGLTVPVSDSGPIVMGNVAV